VRRGFEANSTCSQRGSTQAVHASRRHRTSITGSCTVAIRWSSRRRLGAPIRTRRPGWGDGGTKCGRCQSIVVDDLWPFPTYSATIVGSCVFYAFNR
jgi:hypothetical protein